MKILIIGSGPSTSKILPYANKLHEYFDKVIGLNGVFRQLDHALDYHLVLEKDFYDLPILNTFNFNTKIPRLINYKSAMRFSNKYNIIPITRLQKPEDFNIRQYIKNPLIPIKGLLAGEIKNGISTGTVMLQAIHYACILGATEVYLIGADLGFSKEKDHFYTKEKRYRDKYSLHPNAAKPITHNGIPTTDQFRDAAITLDKHLEDTFKDISVFDFSQGLLTKVIKLNWKDFTQANS